MEFVKLPKPWTKPHTYLYTLEYNCDEPMYVNLVEALCVENKINLIKVGDRKWEMVGCSCVMVKDYL